MKALILVAHPDDEAIFAGALMLARPQWAWKLVALTGGERQAQFPGLSLKHRDEWRILTLREYADWYDSVRRLDLSPDVVFTHNLLGEYGHPHHMAVHRLAHELYGERRVWDFYCDAPSSVGSQQTRIATTQVQVNPAKHEKFRATYGFDAYRTLWAHQPEMMRAAFITGPESFTGNALVPS